MIYLLLEDDLPTSLVDVQGHSLCSRYRVCRQYGAGLTWASKSRWPPTTPRVCTAS